MDSISSYDNIRMPRQASWTCSMLAGCLRGGRKADPDTYQARVYAAEAEELLVAIASHNPTRQQETPATIRPEPNHDDVLDLLGSASSDARYLKYLTKGGSMMTTNVADALRVVRGLRPKLDRIAELYREQPDEPETSGPVTFDELYTELGLDAEEPENAPAKAPRKDRKPSRAVLATYERAVKAAERDAARKANAKAARQAKAAAKKLAKVSE